MSVRKGPATAADRRALQRAAHFLGDYARVLRAFGTEPDGKTWAPGSALTKAEYAECEALRKQLEKLAALARARPDGMLELDGEDI